MSHMAYVMDLSSFTLSRFVEVLTTVELIPSRRALADHIVDVAARLEADGVSDLEALRRLLTNKNGHEALARHVGVDVDYVTLLRREVNSYRTKSTPLANLKVFTEAEVESLAADGVRSTRDIYERAARRADRGQLADRHDLDTDRLNTALGMSNLVRINGVGPAFARFLLDLGMRGPEDVLVIDANEIVRRYNESITGQPGQPKLRVEDIEFCRRFSEGLDSDIEW